MLQGADRWPSHPLLCSGRHWLVKHDRHAMIGRGDGHDFPARAQYLESSVVVVRDLRGLIRERVSWPPNLLVPSSEEAWVDAMVAGRT